MWVGRSTSASGHIVHHAPLCGPAQPGERVADRGPIVCLCGTKPLLAARPPSLITPLMNRPVEFTAEALEDIDDLPEIARALSRAAELGRIVCGQSDPCTLELVIEQLRVLYRLEDHQIVVLGADLALVYH
jgi:hypothetical protein